ncbi:MAG: hypothetical protein K0R53_3078 [Burkholderiales bacterium]|nr:hypothetical protein [Burkholderiales bacterium]
MLDCVHPCVPGLDLCNYELPLRKGWRWAFEGMAEHLPLTFKELESAQPRLEYREVIFEMHGEQQWWGDLLLRIHGRFVPVFAYLDGDTLEEAVARGKPHSFSTSLPPAIALGYGWRVAGLGFVASVPYNYRDESRQWPCRMDVGNGLLSSRPSALKASEDSIMESLMRAASLEVEKPSGKFHLLFDSRPAGDHSISGEQLVVASGVGTVAIYHMQRWDFSTLKHLPDPTGWLDRQTSVILRRMQVSRA